MGDFWVFGYGSLMWRPGFAHSETRRAWLFGYRRALCVRSFDHRGTPERPGLVLGLERGGSCIGMAYLVPGTLRDEVMSYLRGRERELASSVYVERVVPVRLDSGETVASICYTVDRGHEQYAGRLTEADAAAIVRGGVGRSGRNEDYVLNTVAHLEALGIRDHWMEAVADLIRPGHPA